jgi:glycosyltransferase involved in cell wall biosynthesis
MNRLRIVVPVFNDWASFRRLLEELDAVASSFPSSVFITAVDDGSTEALDPLVNALPACEHLTGAEIVHLTTNVGHQRAIAIGLCLAAQDATADAVLIMDADGEDPPAALPYLAAATAGLTDFCIVAQRRKRVETFSFKFFYRLYKLLFRAVTGKTIDFGNFSLLSAAFADRLIMVPDLWNNLPAAILRSRLPITAVPVHRGQRYAGKSKMNFSSLVVHGLSAISVYADTIFVRLLLLGTGLTVLSIISVAVLFGLRIYSPAHATPGWATTIAFGLAIIILQLFLTALSSILMLLNNRVQRLFLPKTDYLPYVAARRRLFGHAFSEMK